jgi:hypothetical protein
MCERPEWATSNGERQSIVVVLDEGRTHLGEWGRHPAHGPAPERPVAGDSGLERMGRQKPKQEAGGGT